MDKEIKVMMSPCPFNFWGQIRPIFPCWKSRVISSDSVYGPTVATSHGVSIPGNNDFVGPDLGAFHKDIGISGLQTGGGSRKKVDEI